MPAKVTFKIDFTEFDQALKEYLSVTTRTLADVLNKKGFYVALGAMRYTPATPKEAITSSLGRIVRTKRQVTMHLVVAGDIYHSLSGREAAAPLAALIINKRMGRLGPGQGLTGQKMADAIAALIGARNRSRAYLRSGWLPTVQTLGPLVSERRGAPETVQGARQYGVPKGRAVPARPGWSVKCLIENAASSRHETNEALIRYGGPALQRAFDIEAHSMEEEVLHRQYEAAKKIGIKLV